MYIYHILIIHSSADGFLRYFHFLLFLVHLRQSVIELLINQN